MGNATGELPTYLLVAVLLTFPASYLVLRAFRYQVQRTMLQTASGPSPRPVVALAAAHVAEPRSARPPRASGSAQVLARLRRRLVLAQVLATVPASVLSTLLFLGFNPDVSPTPLALVLITYAYAWPVVFAIELAFDDPRWRATRLLLAYVGLGLVVDLIWSALAKWLLGRADVEIGQNCLNYLMLLGLNAAPPYLALRLIGAHWMRPVSSFLFAGLLVFCYGGMLSRDLLVIAVDRAEWRTLAMWLGETGFLLITALPIGYLCWAVQRWAGSQYQRKRFGDTQLYVDAVWVVAAFWLCFSLTVTHNLHGLWGLGTFVVYRVTLELALRVLPLDFAPAPRRLLMLRVFGHRRRSEVLFDRVAQRWRLHGNVNMIAGTDLAARTVDPGDLLLFMSGSLRSRFVHDPGELQRQEAALDEQRDPDGRFRVNDFFCFDDTWQPTLERLIGRSDVVLMDLRAFEAKNRGCIHEIRQLAQLDRLRRTLFVVDSEPAAELLRQTVAEVLRDRVDQPELHVVTLPGTSRQTLDQVVGRLHALDEQSARA